MLATIIITFFIILSISLSGCASMNIGRNPITGKIDSVESKGVQDTLVEEEIIEEDVVIKTENGITTKTVKKITTKSKVSRKAAWNIWPENLFTIYKD